jgi:hypothetical protein
MKLIKDCKDYKEYLVLEKYSKAWNKDMPVLLIKYPHGEMDIHCQTGDHHVAAIDEARVILTEKGLKISDYYEMIAPSGMYYKVTKI